MKVSVYNQKGEDQGTTLLPKEVFELPFNPDLVHQVTVSQMANRRQVIAQAKDRSEVSGGGKKPWRQKGTGRARHGSTRSPIWIGGGVTFGPTKERNFKKKINSRMRKKALAMVLSAKAKDGQMFVIDSFSLKEAKTRLIADIFNSLKIKGSVMIILPKADEKMVRAASNLPKTTIVEARNLNALDVLSFKYLVVEKETIKAIKDNFLK